MKTDHWYHRSFYKLIITLIPALLLVITLPLLAQESKQVGVVPAEPDREAEALNLGTELFIYGYPLVIMESVKQVMTNVAAPEGFHAPLGQFAHMRRFPDASFKGVVKPNADTLYSFAWLDLSKEPYILSLPDEKGRYYLMEMLDGWTNVFAAPGKRTTGTKAQKFAIAGPDWKGSLPQGVEKIKSPTNMVWLIGRTYCRGTPEDYKAVHAIQDQYKLVPLSAFGKPFTHPQGQVDPNVDMKTPAWGKVGQMDAASFFKTLAAALKANPPSSDDGQMVAKMAKIGIIPGQDFDMSKLDPAVAKGLKGAPKAAQEKIMAHEKNASTMVNGWTFALNTGAYGTDYLQRAYITAVDLGANLPQDMLYPLTREDCKGEPLDGAHRYILHFPKGQTPPVRGFWSLTMYNNEHTFVPNPLNRYMLTSFSKFKCNRDGSLDLYLQKESPGKGKEANWLPAPEGKFILMLRLYWPKEAALDGTWGPPAITLRNRP